MEKYRPETAAMKKRRLQVFIKYVKPYTLPDVKAYIYYYIIIIFFRKELKIK